MDKNKTIAIVAILAVAVVAAIALKERKSPPAPPVIAAPEADTETVPAPEPAVPAPAPKIATASKPAPAMKPATANKPETKKKQLPRLVDLGADKCIPCKMMAPILEELKQAYKGKLDVEFIDVWKNRSAGDEYKIRVIPTQIFFDADGKEVFRHEGFFSKEDILAKWKEFGVDLAPANK